MFTQKCVLFDNILQLKSRICNGRKKQDWQYYHFNRYTTKEKRDSRKIQANKWLDKAVEKWKKDDRDAAMKWLGYGLHCLQDIDAHGQIGAGSGLPQHIINI